MSDYPEGSVYIFGPQGGSTYDSGTLLTSHAGFRPAGLAFASGRLYLARQGTGDVVEISPQSGQILRTVATGINNATGLATDPLSGDLFVSQAGGGATRGWHMAFRRRTTQEHLLRSTEYRVPSTEYP